MFSEENSGRQGLKSILQCRVENVKSNLCKSERKKQINPLNSFYFKGLFYSERDDCSSESSELKNLVIVL